MALIDWPAAYMLRDLRERQGLSPEALANEIRLMAKDAPWGKRGACDAHTIRRIERHGHVPRERVRFVLANFFDLVPHQVWVPGNARQDESTREQVAA